jgi:hypothetical protein
MSWTSLRATGRSDFCMLALCGPYDVVPMGTNAEAYQRSAADALPGRKKAPSEENPNGAKRRARAWGGDESAPNYSTQELFPTRRTARRPPRISVVTSGPTPGRRLSRQRLDALGRHEPDAERPWLRSPLPGARACPFQPLSGPDRARSFSRGPTAGRIVGRDRGIVSGGSFHLARY